jgi:hypothetical protein
MHWRSPSSPRQKTARESKSEFKAMMIVFSDINGLFMWIGCMKIRTLTAVNGWDEEDLKCGRTAHGFFTKTT